MSRRKSPRTQSQESEQHFAAEATPATIQARIDMTDWQLKLDSVAQRDGFLLDQELWTDCSFSVGDAEKVFECHRLYLAKSSPVFAAMLYGKLHTLGQQIRVPDVTPAAFRALLQYVYHGQVTLGSFEEAFGLLYAGKKYLLPASLLAKVRSFLWARLYPDNVWRALQFAQDNDEQELLETAWQVVELRTRRMLRLESFCEVPLPTLVSLLQRDALACTELELFEACVRWGNRQIKGLARQPLALRKALTPALPLLRFLTMSAQDFTNELAMSDIITDAEFRSLCTNLSVGNCKPLPDNFCDNNVARSEPKFATFFVFGQHRELCFHCKEKNEIDLPLPNTFSVLTNAVVTFEEGDEVLGVQIPTQIKDLGSGKTDGHYEEDVTVCILNDDTEEKLSTTRFTGTVAYNSGVDVPIIPRTVVDKKVYCRAMVIFHKTGRYPARRDTNVMKINMSGKLFGRGNVEEIYRDYFLFIRKVFYA